LLRNVRVARDRELGDTADVGAAADDRQVAGRRDDQRVDQLGARARVVGDDLAVVIELRIVGAVVVQAAECELVLAAGVAVSRRAADSA
jgi:hypothetical protein